MTSHKTALLHLIHFCTFSTVYLRAPYDDDNNNNNNNNNLLTANGLSPGGSGYFTFKLRQTY
jgi:hypothetical protein